MKTGLDHLPEGKSRELAHVVAALREGFAEAKSRRTQPRFRNGRLLKIILFGSYARDDWVEDPVGRYYSDYDLLVVVDHEDLTDVPEFWAAVKDRLLAELSDGKALRTLVSLVYHSLEDVNEKLRLGRYFFIDILRDGIALFEEPGLPSTSPGRCRRSRPWTRRGPFSSNGSRALRALSAAINTRSKTEI